jgi:hypothetical protein
MKKMIKCVWASIDERRRASGGSAGDQTGCEVKIGSWYNFGQNVILRPKSAVTASRMIKAGVYLAQSNLVGYDQGQRRTLYNELKKVNWHYKKLTHKCETDCSAFIACLVNCAGIRVSGDLWTGNLRHALVATGKFTAIYGSKYTSTDANIRKGDIILNEAEHVILAIQNGANVKTGSTTAVAVPTVTLQYGARGEQVKRLQRCLNKADSAGLAVDGSFGPATLRAVKRFQRKRGLTVDGSVGPKTRAALKKAVQ